METSVKYSFLSLKARNYILYNFREIAWTSPIWYFFTQDTKVTHPLFLSKTQNYIIVLSQLNVHDQNFGITHHPNKFLKC